MQHTYRFLTSREVKPTGWLRRQLEIEAHGLVGNLDKVWPDVKNSRWIGGDREGWERVPYWLDGFLPLAYLLDDEDLIARAQKYIEAILAGQKEDGWICPNGDTPREKYDTWAVELLSKVLCVYYDCTGDARIPGVLSRMLRNWYDGLKSGALHLFNWAESRWFEAMIAIDRLYELQPEAWLCDLAKILKEQGRDWGETSRRWDVTYNEWTYGTHIVNIAMAMKAEAVSCSLCGTPYKDDAEAMFRILTRYHGMPAGIFAGDECLADTSPIRGAELCSVVELMYSYEWLFAVTGAQKWAERLERVAFNALPATVSDDMWTHQYDQMTNQNACVAQRGRALFGTNSYESHFFGLEPNYGCCTANFGQGWPKFALSAVMQSKNGLRVAVPVPVRVQTDCGGVPVTLEIESDYPFRNTYTVVVTAEKACDFELSFCVPSFALHPCVNGKAVGRGLQRIRGFSAGETRITVAFETEVKALPGPRGLRSLSAGSLVFALPVQAEWVPREYTTNGVERKFPYCDYELKPKSPWNYGFAVKETADLTVKEQPLSQVPFSSVQPPVTLPVRVCPVDWDLEPGYRATCRAFPKSRKAEGDPITVDFVPYGCAKLRMTELPVCKK